MNTRNEENMNAAITLCTMQKKITEQRLTFKTVWDEDLTSSEVSEATGIHMNTLTKYKKGTLQARLDILLKLKDFFEKRLDRTVPLDEFVESITYIVEE